MRTRSSFPRRRAAVFALLLASGSLTGAAESAAVRIAADASGTSTRLVLTFSRPVGWEVASGDGKITVSFAEPVQVTPPEARREDPILQSWRSKGDRTIVFSTGPAFRKLESFELRNPARLVLDLQGEGTAATAPAGREAAGRPPARVVVIDPGHGGIELGAVGPKGLREKDVALDIARRLQRALGREDGVIAVLTRDEDRLVPLDERAAIANHNRAELFVSIHLNASRRTGAVGAETYFLSPDATDDEARTLAALENRASGVEEARPAEPAAPSDRDLDLVLWDLAQNQYLAESGRLAESVQEEMNALAGTKDRGVRQAPFRVLMGATMPAILVEVGFLTSPEEEERLRDSAHLDRVAQAIARAVSGYLRGRERLDAPGAAR